MWKTDLLFNGLLLVIDILAFRYFQNLWKRSRWISLLIVPLLYGWAALGLAMAVTHYSMLRPFATMRFLGMTLFWHLPFLLLAHVCIARIPVPYKGRGKGSVVLHQGEEQYRPPIRVLPAVLAILLLAVYVYAYHVEPRTLEISRYEFKHDLLRGLQRPIVIAQISDIQTDQVGNFERKVFEQLRELRPDIIIHTGDYLHCWTASSYAEQTVLLRSLMLETNLKPEFGSFAVLGDSDRPDLWKNIFQSQPVRILEDETVVLNLPGVSVNLTGLNPVTSRAGSIQELRKPLQGIQKDLLQIFVGHSPDYVLALQQTDRPFLALAGHTHGGQVQLPFIGPILTLTRISRQYGEYYGVLGSGVLSVSRGIGMERQDAPRLRFLCPPEIRLITLQPLR